MTKEFVWNVIDAHDKYLDGFELERYEVVKDKKTGKDYIYPDGFDGRVCFEPILWEEDVPFQNWPKVTLDGLTIYIDNDEYYIKELRDMIKDYDYWEDEDGTEGAKEV
jgi:hypothetical protein